MPKIWKLYRQLRTFCIIIVLGSLQATAQDSIKIIAIRAIPGLQFDKVRFTVKPSVKVRIRFFNADDMDHNLLIVKPGSREKVVKKALELGADGPGKSFTPASDDVLWHIPITSPEQSNEIAFTAPQEPGAYPYVCTYPGHGFVMYGVMHVSKTDSMPPLEDDPDVPPNKRKGSETITGHSHHPSSQGVNPYAIQFPYLYRVYIDGSSPAAIVVGLPHNLSYCWDAGTCRLRFAWTGGFVDNSDLWKGKGDAESKVIGSVFFKDKVGFPLLTNRSEPLPKVSYKGYKLIDNYPEFHYMVDEMEVFELIKPKEDGSGLLRTFRVINNKKDIWFVTHPGDGIKWTSSTGKWDNGKLKLSATESAEFTLTMNKTK